MSTERRVAIVLHAGGMRGAQIVKQLLEEKDTFVVCVDTVPSLIATHEPLRTLFMYGDITKKKDVEHVTQKTMALFGAIHIIGNAHNKGKIERLGSGLLKNIIAVSIDDLMLGIRKAGALKGTSMAIM